MIGWLESRIFWWRGETTDMASWYWVQVHTGNGYRQTHIPPCLVRRVHIIYETLELSLTYQCFLRQGEKKDILSDFDESQGGHLTLRGPALLRFGFAGRQWLIEFIKRSNAGERIQGGNAPEGETLTNVRDGLRRSFADNTLPSRVNAKCIFVWILHM